MINKLLKIDWILLLSVLLLLGIGLTVLYSISTAVPSDGKLSIFWRQLIFVFVGCFHAFFCFFRLSELQIKKYLDLFSHAYCLGGSFIFWADNQGDSWLDRTRLIPYSAGRNCKIITYYFSSQFYFAKKNGTWRNRKISHLAYPLRNYDFTGN